METKTPNGRDSSWAVLQKILIFCLLLGMFLPGTINEAFAAATLTVKLPKLPNATHPVLLSVRAIEAETGRFLANVSLTKQSSQVQLKVEAVPQIVFADLFTSDGNTFSDHSHVLRPVDRKKLTVTLQLKPDSSAALSEMADRSGESLSPSADTAGPPDGIGRVGVPSSGFTAEGIDLPPRGVALMVTTNLSKPPCYNEAGGFVVVLTDPQDLASRQAEVDFSNSSWADPSTALKDLYVSPSYFVNGSFSSDGTNLTVTYRLVDSNGNELLSQSATGPENSFFDIHDKVASELANAMCCNKSKTVKCAKAGSIDIDTDYDIPHPDCPINHQSVQGNIKFSLRPVVTDTQNVCEYSGVGTSTFKSDSECTGGVFLHTTCTIDESIAGKVPKPAFPLCGSLVVDFSEVWNCTSVDNLGTQFLNTSLTFTEAFQYKDGYVLDFPVAPNVGRSRLILHLK
jgi:hypothetical protein